MDNFTLKLPATINDFTLQHVNAIIEVYENYKELAAPTYLNKCKHISIYTGVDIEILKRASRKDIDYAFIHIYTEIGKYKKSTPPFKIELKGVTYILADVENQTAGWLIDYEANKDNFKAQPELLAALCYIEEGKAYGEVPLSTRANRFKYDFKAVDFLDLNAFFLKSYEAYIAATALHAKNLLKKKTAKTSLKNKINEVLVLLNLR
jgi:hypothetical protein